MFSSKDNFMLSSRKTHGGIGAQGAVVGGAQGAAVGGASYAEVVSGALGAAVGGRAQGAAAGGGCGGDDDVPGEIILFRGGGGGAPGAAAAIGDGAHGAAVGGGDDCNVFELLFIRMFNFMALRWYVNPACVSDAWTVDTTSCTFSCNFEPTVDESRTIQVVIPTLWYAFSHPTKSLDMIQNFFFAKDEEGSIVCWVVKKDAFASKMKTCAYKTYWHKRGLPKCPDWIEGVTTPNSIKDIINRSNMDRLGTGHPKMKNPAFSVQVTLNYATILALEKVAEERTRLVELEAANSRRLDELKAQVLCNGVWSRSSPDEFMCEVIGHEDPVVVDAIKKDSLRQVIFGNPQLLWSITPKDKGDTKAVVTEGSIWVISLKKTPSVDEFTRKLRDNAVKYFTTRKFLDDGILASATERVDQMEKHAARRLKQHTGCHKHSVLAVSKPHTPKSKPQQVEAVKEVNREFKDSGKWLLAVEEAMSVGDESKRAHLLRVGKDMGCLRLWPKRVVD